MLNIDKSTVDFLVTENMVDEVKGFLNETVKKITPIVDKLFENRIEKICFVGCGSCRGAGMAGKYIFDKYSTIDVKSYTGWEFVDNTPRCVGENCAVILISHSGKTEEIVAALKKAKCLGAITIAVTDTNDNPLALGADFVVDYHAHCIWEIHLLSAYYIACSYIQRISPDREVEDILKDMGKLPPVLEHLVKTYEDKALEMAKQVRDWKGFYTVAAGPLFSLGYKEGVITNMEFLWSHGSALESGEFRHGPLEITDENSSFLFLLGTDPSRHTTQRALDFVKKYKGKYIVFDYMELSEGLHPELSPFVLFPPIEWFCYYFAIVRDHNPDDRRYYNVVEY